MYSKCDLIINDVAYHVTNELKNWDDISSTFKRSDYDGVARSFSNKFEFTGGAYDLLKAEYRKNYLAASAEIAYYTRNNSWLWNERFRLSLDFSTFSDNGSVISINAIDNSLASLIKAKKGTQYEYSMAQIKDSKTLYYDGMLMNQSVDWLVAGNSMEDSVDVSVEIQAALKSKYFPLSIKSSEVSIGGYITSGNTYQTSTGDKDTFLFKAERNMTCYLNISISFNIPENKSFVMMLVKVGADGDITEVATSGINDEHPETMFVFSYMKEITLVEGEYYYIRYTSLYNMTLIISNPCISLSWVSRIVPVYIDVTTPTTVLNRLLQSMNGGKSGITGEIMKGVDERLDNCVIVPAESVRALPKAKFYTSYSKFTDWMKTVFGFVPVIEENKVRFVHRDMLFQNKVVKEIESIRDFEYSVNSSLIYSRVRVGYDKQDYESVNGKDEFRFTNEYTTGIELTDNALELISPYRADAYGIEFLVQKRGEDTTDNTSDNDVFFVNATVYGSEYRLVRSGYTISGVISPGTMFNVAYAPRFMIKANKKLIGASIGNLHFASSDGNSDVVIDGVSESADIAVSERLFTVGTVSFQTGDLDIPTDFSGLVTLTKNGEVYKGFIEKVTVNYGRAEAVKYSLVVESIEKVK